MTWSCAAINHSVTIYQNGTISPCCLIDYRYRKNLNDIDKDPFSDLRTGVAPQECQVCTDAENAGLKSYRQHFNDQVTEAKGIQFVDIRNSNLCNLKCRICSPNNSSQWAKIMQFTNTLKKTELDKVKQYIFTESTQQIYYTGGEPFINEEHWNILDELIDLNLSKNIHLFYNTNCTTLKFKGRDILSLWKNFKTINVMASIDGINEKFNFLRSGAEWQTVSKNLETLREQKINLTISTTVSILNVWFIVELLEYFKDYKVDLSELNYPYYLSLSAIPDSLKTQALSVLDQIEMIYADKKQIEYFKSKVKNNIYQHLFDDTLLHTLMFDKVNQENLFDLLPFKDEAITRAFKDI